MVLTARGRYAFWPRRISASVAGNGGRACIAVVSGGIGRAVYLCLAKLSDRSVCATQSTSELIFAFALNAFELLSGPVCVNLKLECFATVRK